MSLTAKCEACAKPGPVQFTDERDMLCAECIATGRKPVHHCDVCWTNVVAKRDDVCGQCKRRSAGPPEPDAQEFWGQFRPKIEEEP